MYVIAWYKHEEWLFRFGGNNNHKKTKTNESITVGNKETNTELNMEFSTLKTSVGKKVNEPISVTQVLVTKFVGSLNDASVYADVYIESPNTTGPTINVVNSETTSPNQNGGDQFPLALVHKVNDRMKNFLYVYFIGKRLAFPVIEWFVRNNWEKYGLEKFHDVLLVAYTSDGLSLMDTKISTLMMLDSYTNSMCLESWGRSSYARILIEMKACNEFSDHLVMVVPNLKGNGYTKETIRIEYEYEPPRSSTCLIFALNDENLIIKEVETGSMATTSGTQEEGQSFTSIVDTINVLDKQLLEGKLVLVDYDGKSLEKVDYLGNLGSDDEVEPVENEMPSFLASKPMGGGYGSKSLLKQ
ncbi:hypothetical protein Tco_0066701 [Tanacetum coccineum]